MATETIVRDEDLFGVPLATMQPGTLAPADLYIRFRRPSRVVLYKSAYTPLREEIRARLVDRGVSELYLRKQDERAYHDYVEQNITAIIRDDLMPARKACELVYQSSSRVMAETFDDPRSGRNMQRAHTMVEATVLSIMKDPEALWHMTAMASHDYYTYTHCVHVCMFLVSACRDMLGITDQALLRPIGMGGIFHDIGKSQIPSEILSKPGRLTNEEFEKVKQHPILGVNIVKDDRRVPRSATHIIRSHHEHYNGCGYPSGLAGEGINKISRLATIIDVYDALTTKRAYAPARDPFTALDMMLHQMPEQFDTAMLRGFVKFLGPKEFRMEMRARWDSMAAHAIGRNAPSPDAQVPS
jgi:putative nucleotidyltransferase with HDIG domain